MKKLLFAVSALAALSLLAPSTGFAQYPPHMGLYTAEMEVNVDAVALSTTSTYLVATNFPGSVTQVLGYGCNLAMTGGAGIITGVTWPADAINVTGDLYEHVVGYSLYFPQPVVDGAVTLATIDFMVFSEDPTMVVLSFDDNSIVPGNMWVTDATDIDDVVYIGLMTSAGAWDGANFAFNADPDIVATDSATFGNVKAMYR